MNFIAVIILVALLIDYGLNLAADLLNLSRLEKKLPPEYADIYDPDRYEKSQKYLKVNTRFGWVTGTFDLLVVLIFWFAGGFALLDVWVRGLGHGPVISGLIFIGVLVAFKSLFSLPFEIYSTFVIEERFGFNRTTPSTFVMDRVKGILLGILLGGPLLAAILGFFAYAGTGAWLYCWIAATLYLLGVQYIAPNWIMPLFNKYKPLEEGELRMAIMDYSASQDFSLTNVFVIDGSRRSDKPNAFFTGFGRNKRVALFDTLISELNVAELVAVLAHEIGHYKKKHILQSLLIGILHMGVTFFLLSLFLTYEPLFFAFYVDTPSVYAGLLFFGLLLAPIDLFLGIFISMLSRRNEHAADRFAVRTTKTPGAMANALKKLSSKSLSNLFPHPFYVFLHYSHPPLSRRLAQIEVEGRNQR